MLLTAQRDVNRRLDADVHLLMSQLEDLNRRYAALGRRTAGLQVVAASSPPHLRSCLFSFVCFFSVILPARN